jgi:hypothetical protein
MSHYDEGGTSSQRIVTQLGYNQVNRGADIHSAYPCMQIKVNNWTNSSIMAIPRLNELDDGRVLVNSAIIHYNH